jgi:hypothetical protein
MPCRLHRSRDSGPSPEVTVLLRLRDYCAKVVRVVSVPWVFGSSSMIEALLVTAKVLYITYLLRLVELVTEQ